MVDDKRSRASTMADCQRPFKISKCNHHHHRDWSSLPDGILFNIFSRLFFTDCYSFANVCTSWRSVVPSYQEMPFLFLHMHSFIPKPCCKLINLTDNIFKDVHMPILGGKVCIGSQDGWLIVVDNAVSVISLYNPFSRQEIQLPCHDHIVAKLFPKMPNTFRVFDFVRKDFTFRKVVLSEMVATNSTKPFPAAVAIFDTGHLMYKPEGDNGWKSLQTHRFQDITYWRGDFVGITPMGQLKILYLDEPNPFVDYIFNVPVDIRYPSGTYYKHLVKLNDDLLQIWWLIDPQTQRSITVKIMLLDLDYNSWIPIDDLRGHSLFLSPSHSFSLPSQGIPGLKDNLVYFMDELWIYRADCDMSKWKRKVGVFDLRTGSYDLFPLPNTRLPPSTFAFWYLPPLAELRN